MNLDQFKIVFIIQNFFILVKYFLEVLYGLFITFFYLLIIRNIIIKVYSNS